MAKTPDAALAGALSDAFGGSSDDVWVYPVPSALVGCPARAITADEGWISRAAGCRGFATWNSRIDYREHARNSYGLSDANVR